MAVVDPLAARKVRILNVGLLKFHQSRGRTRGHRDQMPDVGLLSMNGFYNTPFSSLKWTMAGPRAHQSRGLVVTALLEAETIIIKPIYSERSHIVKYIYS